MELECDLSNINNEELLRKMWQQSEDSNRKKEIRSQLYKLRESRLKDLYQGDIMSDNTIAGFGKDPLTTSHGDALADQSFQSLKSKEIRDSMSPTEMKFQSMALNHPSTTGWNVQSSKEVSPDGRGFRAETIATTDGVENINGGTAEFKGRNEQFSSAHQQGDDKNFVKKAMESAKSHLQEKVVIGDENSGRTEVRTSSSTSTSSSQVFQSSSNVEYDDRGVPIAQQPQQHQPYLMDPQRHQQQEQQYHQEQQRLQEEQRLYEQQFRQQHQQQLNQQQERRTSEQYATTRQNTEKKNTSQNVQTQETLEQNKRYVDMDKASPEYQQHVQHLMQQPGEIISQNVEYPKPNVKMITTVKRLPDGTIVRNKRYETEEPTPTTPPTRQTTSTTNQTNQRRDSQQQTKNYQPDLTPSNRGAPGAPRRPTEDVVDNVETSRYVQDTHNDDVETTFSTVKKSSRKFVNESTSETIHESSNPETTRIKSVTSDFSTHGFPSVKSNKPTQEYPSDRPQGTRPSQGYPSQPMTSGPSDAVIPHFPDDVQNITERRIPTKDGELIIVSSEKKRNYKTSTNSERIVETEHNISDDQHYQQISDKTQDFTTHGFPSVRGPAGAQPKNYPEHRQVQPQDFPLSKIPPGTRIITTTTTNPNEDHVVVSSQKSHTVKNSSNTERVIEHEVIRDDQGSYPRIQPNTEHTIYNYTVTTPGEQYPGGEFPGSPRRQPTQDYSTHGFPSVRSPNKTTPSSQGYPSTNRPNGNAEAPRMSPTKTQPRATSPNKFRAPNTTRETTERVIRKEKEVDSAHRAFAASLRSSSPVDSTRRDSYTTDGRHTPRSSVSSTKNFRRDMREGSHDSAPSETSRISTTTVTRQTPPRSVGGKTTVTKVVTTKTAPGSNDSSPRATKSPSPGKIVTTTTTTKTITSKTPTSPTKEVPKSTDNHQHTRKTSTTTTTTKKNPDTIFPINHVPLTITKTKFSDNHNIKPKQHQNLENQLEKKVFTSPLTSPGIIEEPCLKKQFYLLGPSDQPLPVAKPYKNSQNSEKSSLKQSSPQPPAPSSRTSTPSIKSSKPLMADDQDDQPEKYYTTQPTTTSSPISPSRSSRTPKQQPIGPNHSEIKPNSKDVDNHPRKPVNNDERRTVNRETTFEKIENSPERGPKPTYEQPNIEWVVVDDVDIERDEDDDDHDYDQEDVDFGLNIKTTTQKLIKHEKDVPVAPNRRPKQISSTIRTKQEIYKEMTRPQGRPGDKSPSKVGPQKPLTDARTPTQSRPQKLVPDTKTPQHLTSRIQPTKPTDNKQHPKGPKTVPKSPTKDALPSSTSTQRKSLTKVTTDDHLVRKTLKTSEIVKDRTTKVVDDKRFPVKETPKRRIQSPEHKPKQTLPYSKNREETVTVIEITQKSFPEEDTPKESPDNKPKQHSPVGKWPEQTEEETITVTETTQKRLPQKGVPKGRSPSPDNKPKQRSPIPKWPRQTEEETITVTETTQTRFPEKDIPKGRSPSPDNKPKQRSPIPKWPRQTEEETITVTETTQKRFPEKDIPKGRSPSPDNKPKQRSPVPKWPRQTEEETITVTETTQKRFPENDIPKGRSPSPDNKPKQRSPVPKWPPQTEEETITVTETTKKRFPEKDIPKGRSPSPDNKPKQRSPVPKWPRQTEKETVTVTETTQNRFPEKVKPKGRSPSPDNKPKQRSPVSRWPEPTEEETITVTETTQTRFPERDIPKRRSESPENRPKQRTPGYQRETDDQESITVIETTQKRFPEREIPKRRSQSPENRPKQQRPDYSPETNDEEDILVIESTKKHVLTEKQTQELEDYITEPIYPDNKAPKYVDTYRPQKGPKSPQRELPQSPKKDDSSYPTPQQRKPKQNILVNDQTFRNTLRTTEISTTKMIEDEEFPEEEVPYKKGPKPEMLPKDRKPIFEKPTETDEDESFTETREFVIKSSQNRVISEQEIQEFEESSYPNNKAPKKGPKFPNKVGPQSPKKDTSPYSSSPERKPKQNVPDDKQTFRKTLRTTENLKEITTTVLDDEEFPEEDAPYKKGPTPQSRPKSPQRATPQSFKKDVSPKPTPNDRKPKQDKPVDDQTFRKTLKTTEIVKEKTTKILDDEEFPEDNTPYNKYPKSENKPKVCKPGDKEPFDTEEDETFTETSEFVLKTSQKRVVSEKNVQKFEEEPNYPDDKSPKYQDSTKPKKGPKTPNKDLPQSPKKDVSPTRTQKKPDQKLPENDQTFRKTLRTTEVLKEKTSKFLDSEKFPEEEKPYKKGPRPESTPKDKPDFEKPSTETDEDESYTSEFVIKSSRTQVHELEDFVTEQKFTDSKQPQKEPKSPNKHVSPTRPQRKPDQKLPENDQTFRKTLKTTEVTKTTKTLDTKEFPEKDSPKKVPKPERKPKDGKPGETDEEETFTQTNEFTYNTTKKHLVSEKQVVETEEETNFPHKSPKKGPKELPKTPRKDETPTSDTSPLKPHKNLPVDDQTFRKTLRTTDKTTEIYTDQKNKPKDRKPQETDEDLPTTDNEELLIETCETHIVTEKNFNNSPKPGPKTSEPIQKRPNEEKPYNQQFTTTHEETIETVKDQTHPKDDDKLPRTTKTPKSETFKTEAETIIQEALKPHTDKPKPTFTSDEKWLPKKTPVQTSNINEQFIKTERVRTEAPDGAFISKTTEPSEPLSPTFKKKGAGRNDTFEERCRHILGMETYGDTPGTFKKQPVKDVEETKEEIVQNTTTTNEDFKNTTIFQVKIEDCGDDDDEPLSINTVHKQIHITEQKRNEPVKEEPKGREPEDVKEKPRNEPKKKPIEPMEKPKRTRGQPLETKEKPLEEPKKTPRQPSKPERKPATKSDYSDTDEFAETITETTVITKTPRNLSPEPKRKPKETSPKKSPKTKPLDDTDDTSEQETYISSTHFEDTQEHIEVIKNQTKKSELKITKKSTPSTSPRSVSPTKESTTPRTKSSTKEVSSPKTKSPTKEVSSPRTKSPTKDSISPRSISPTKDSTSPRSISPTKDFYTPRSVLPDMESFIITLETPTKESLTPRTKSPSKESSSPRSLSPTKQPLKPSATPKRKPSRESLEPKTTKTTPKKPTAKPDSETKTTTTTIKDRLRSSTRKTKSPTKQDQVDGSDSSSSSEPSPTRITERRRSSNISVITEILIDHTDMEHPGKKEKSPGPKRPQDSVFKDIIDSTVLPDKLPRKMLVTERKESAPVHRVTHKDKDSKMSRSTSENLIKVKKPENNTLSPKPTPKSTEHRRPNKCFATKSINLTTTDRLVNSQDMENVIIDIQHAKSSREPSPDKIVPTPVPAHLDTGKPRYPDVVQEPEDEQPRKKPLVKNIPIFEEEHNSYVGCHITEVNMEKTTRRTTMDSLDCDQEILNNPLIEAPPSLDYPSLDKSINEDECLLTVHEKVNKFQHIAEEVKKPKPSSPFTREFDDTCKVPQEDECLLTVDEKVDKFLKTAESITKPITPVRELKKPFFEVDTNEEEDEEFVRNERIYTTIKLTPSEPQKSPNLVRNISRHISRQSDVDAPTDLPLSTTEDSDYGEAITPTNEDFVECLNTNQQKTSTEEFKMTHRETLNKKYQQIPKKPFNDDHHRRHPHNDDEDDAEEDVDSENNKELIPHTATHTTIIEQRRQKDILSRPSVFDNKINKKPNATTTTIGKTPLKTTTTKATVKDSEKLRPDNKSRTKPATATENLKTSTLNKRKTTTTSSSLSPQRKHSDIEYEELRGAGSGNNKNVVETGVGIISKQTKVYSNTNNTSNNTLATTSHTTSSNQRTTNDLKKSTQVVNKKQPEKFIPVRLTPAKNLDERDLNTDDEEMLITVETTTTTSTKTPNDIPLNSGKVNKDSYTTTPSQSPRKQPVHSSTNSSTAPSKSTTKEHVIKITESSTLNRNLDNTYSPNRKTDKPETFETPETVLEAPKRSPYTPKTKTTMDTVAARRSLFENNNGSTTPTRRTPIASPLPGRRPSYMDHTKSSLEHTRRDSLEINKTNYSRKPSHTEEDQPQDDRNTLVKFNVPHSKLQQEVITTTHTSVTEDINIEEIFDLEVLERMLETVTSYEIRRRIRAQIRLIKKNQKNETMSTEITSTTTLQISSKPSLEEPDTKTRKPKPTQPRERSLSPTSKSTKQFLIKESETQQSYKKQSKRQEMEVEEEEEEENIHQSPLRPKSSPSHSPQRYHHEDSEYIRDRSPDTKRKSSKSVERSQSPQEKPVCARNVRHNRPRYPYEEDDNEELIPHTARHTTQIEERRQKDILTRPSVFDNKKSLPRSHSPQEDKPKCARNVAHNRSHSPESQEVVREYGSKTTVKKHYYQKNEEHEEVDEINHETRRQSSGSPTRKITSTSRKSPYSSPERDTLTKRDSSPESRKPLKTSERSRSPPGKSPKSRLSAHSPDNKSTSLHKTSATYEQSLRSSTTKQPQPKRSPMLNSPATKPSKPQEKSSTPVWADRKNVLKTPSSNTTTPRKPITSSLDSRSGFTKTTKSSMTTQKMSTNKSSFVEDDCITSSYGIGPTDENGLPLFGIRALKKKKQPPVEPCETTEEVTGYVVEEKYYSDNKTKPIVERKELIYSTNPDELEKIKEQVKGSTTRQALKDAEVKETRQTALITKTNAKATPALRSSPEDDFLDSTTKYVRRGSVKEMSEKFIHRESSSSITEKSSYPKAGLILRTNSRKNSRDNDTDGETYDSYKKTRVQHSTVLADSDDAEHEYEVEESGSRHSGRFINESESECESIQTQREFKKVSSSTSSSTRSFLNSQGEEKVITNVSDCLERMRNADNVIEEGDTTEDQEARALLNKFLGASIIMTGVESSISPASSNRQSKIITTTTTNNNRSEPAKHEVKTTRVTKTIKSGNSSTPVTHTTCDIEEIWDEEILKELLEQARTYEERRKIRSRLRELMADREEKNTSQAGDKEVKPTSTETTNVQEEDSSASEYEEIIEEVTDYSESEAEEAVADKKSETKKQENLEATKTEVKETTKVVKSEETEKKSSESSCSDEETVKEEEVSQEKVDEKVTKTTVIKSETKIEKVEQEIKEEVVKQESKESVDKTDTSEKGESKPQGSTTSNQSTTNSQKLKSVQNSSKTKISSEKNSSMHAPYNKTSSSSTTASKTSQNPIVTVQTAGSNRADSTLISNKSLNSSSKVSSSNNSSSVVSNLVAVGNNSPRQVDRLGVPQKEDSGTESGEDLRLIAAGLRDQLQIQSDSNIIEDVTCALKRLESSLKEGKDIAVDLEKRKALLALVARLQAGLTSPEKLAEIAAAMSELDGNEGLYGETSSPEADAHRSNRSRFAKRRSRINRHTVGVSREELADARRYMEDMMMMSNSISQSTTPEANNPNNISPPQWYPLEKNASTGAVTKPPSPSILQRPKQFVSEEANPAKNSNKLAVNNNNNKRRPLSGDYSVSFDPQVSFKQEESSKISASSRELNQIVKQQSPPEEDNSKFSRFSNNKKHLMKRANTIDLAKTQKYNSEFDTDSDAEDKGPHMGLKRAVQVSVKKRVGNVVPHFEPKTENDRKFLAFINKQSDKPGLGWTTSRSVSNWTNKFGSIKNTFEGGLVSKPPPAPHHSSHHSRPQQQATKLFNQPVPNNSAAPFITTNQQIAQRLKQEAERQAEERRRKLEREHLEYERRERDKLERQRQQRERQERERLEREYFERQRREQDQIAAAQHAAILREQEQLAKAQQAANMQVPKPMPINEFKHAPQSVFRPIDNVEHPAKPIYKPIPQHPINANNWQSMNSIIPRGGVNNNLTPTSPSHYGNTRPDNSFITSPTPSSRSPIGLPWASKPTVDSSSFKTKAHRFEERSKYDNVNSGAGPFLQRHNSLRSANSGNNQQLDEFRKRPSLPNTCDPYSVNQLAQQHPDPLAYLPPPQNISFTYSDLKPKVTYQSYPCLPTAVVDNAPDLGFHRSREDSLTDPHSVPLVLTSSNPSYCPPQQQQQQLSQPRLPRQFDIVSPLDSAPTSPSIMLQTDCTDDDVDSDNLLEYHAVSRVMGKPQSQTAVTVGRRTGHASDDELYGKNSRAARNLLSTMKNLGNSNGDRKQKPPMLKRSEQVSSPKQCLSPDGRSYQAPIVEPLFPDVTNFEANRTPLYVGQPKQQPQTPPSYAPKYEPPRQNKYKSMENLNRTPTSASNYMSPLVQPLPPQAPIQSIQPPKPYVSETQASYVVTYPMEDTTDDEDFSRHSQRKMLPPTSLDLRRQRNISETSTGSSTTASLSYSHNLPSPNTSWTANPIMSDDSRQYQNVTATYPTGQQRIQPQASVQGLSQSLAEQTYTYKGQQSPMTAQSPLGNQQHITPSDYMRTASFEAREMPRIPPQQQIPTPTYEAQPQMQMPTMPPQTSQLPLQNQYQTTAYEVQPQRPLPPMAAPAPQLPLTNQYQTTTYEAPPQRPIPPMAAQTPQLPPQTQYQTTAYEVQPQRPLPPMAAQTPQLPQQNLYQNTPNDAQPQRQLPTMPPQQSQQPAKQKTTSTAQKSTKTVKKTSASAYEAQPQKQLQTMGTQKQTQQVSSQKKSTKSTSETHTQSQVTSVASRTQKPPITQKPTDYQKTSQQIKQSSQTTMTATSAISQESINNKKSLASMRKSVSVDQPNVREQMVINPQNSNISQEMLTKLDQQRERINNDIRRKSLGNALDYQLEKQARYETQQQTEIYKSSAPSNTPDIVKSSLPKDENQPILKKFGPPQRHHYMPNSYQSPGTNVTSSSNSTSQSTTIHSKNMEVSSNKTIVRTSHQQQQHISANTRPAVVETPATPQPDDDYIPRNIVFNNVHAFTSMSRRQDEDTSYSTNNLDQSPVRPNKLSKSDSWNQIIQLQNQQLPPPSPKFNQSPTNELRRTKSGHTLALPKMYEAAMAKADINEKQKTVAAYFSGQKSPIQQEVVIEQHTTKKSVINRTKTSEKVSAASRKSLGSNLPIAPGGLTRSATMPHIANLNLLDESNVEDAFEQLMMDQKQQKSSSSTTEKTETKEKDGAVVTTTTKVTTRTVSGSAPKPASPFAKFKQLDRQNSQQSAKSPTTPTTPGGATTASPSSGNQPIFKFTDPALNARAATVKDQLLQWCQMKTQEYENIEITNFSTSWNNGLAFCALLHHFLPDAFDYSQLTPKNRRKNFELAFTVADEKAGIAPLLDVEDMVVMQRPDWKCVFIYVQSIYRRFRNCQ